MAQTLANGYSSDCIQQELSNEYQHDSVQMVFKNICALVLWTKEALALEGLVLKKTTTLNQFDITCVSVLLMLSILHCNLSASLK